MVDTNHAKHHFRENAVDWMERAYKGGGYLYPTAHRRAKIASDIVNRLGSDLRVVDIGCGGGRFAGMLAADGHSVHGFDQAPSMVELAREEANQLSPEVLKNLSFDVLDIETEKPDLAPVDVVTSLGVIGYLSSDNKLFQTANDLLKSGGHFIVSCRNRLLNMNSISFRTEREINDGGAIELLKELQELYKPFEPSDVNALVAAFQALPEKLSAWQDKYAETSKAAPDRGEATASGVRKPKIEARQHTPREIRRVAEAYGFTETGLYGVHPHLLDANANNLMPPGLFDVISSCLDELAAHPTSIAWSSVFISVLRKE